VAALVEVEGSVAAGPGGDKRHGSFHFHPVLRWQGTGIFPLFKEKRYKSTSIL